MSRPYKYACKWIIRYSVFPPLEKQSNINNTNKIIYTEFHVSVYSTSYIHMYIVKCNLLTWLTINLTIWLYCCRSRTVFNSYIYIYMSTINIVIHYVYLCTNILWWLDSSVFQWTCRTDWSWRELLVKIYIPYGLPPAVYAWCVHIPPKDKVNAVLASIVVNR